MSVHIVYLFFFAVWRCLSHRLDLPGALDIWQGKKVRRLALDIFVSS